MNDPKVVRGAERGGWGCDAAWADDFHHALRVALTGDDRRLVRGVRATCGTLAKALHRPHVHDGTFSTFRGRRFGAPRRRRRRPSASSSSPPTTTRSATAPSATACPPRARPLAALLTLSGTVHADALPGRGVRRGARRSSSSPTTSTPEIAEATREGRRREFAAFAAFGRGDPRSPGPDDLRALQADPPRASPPGCATLYRAALALRAASCGRRAEADGARRRPPADACAAGPYRILANFGDEPWPLRRRAAC